MSIPPHLLVHTARVEPYLGAGAYRESYGATFDLPCYYEGTRRLVRTSDGAEAVSTGTAYADTTEIPAGSRVTVAGRTTYVLSVATFTDGGLTGLDHIEVALA